jgi:hypothetical protein
MGFGPGIGIGPWLKSLQGLFAALPDGEAVLKPSPPPFSVELRTMKMRTFLVLAVALAAIAGMAGCDRDGREAVETGRDAEGRATVHVDGDEVKREIDEAGEHVERGAEQVKEGAKEVGAALERGAERVQREVGPVVEEALDDATISARSRRT